MPAPEADLTAPSGPATADRVRSVLRSLGPLCDPDGFVPFDRFMEVALYAEGLGYYAGDRSPTGPAGDFYTAPQVHPLFGATLGDRARAVHRALGERRPLRLVELGPGDGSLAAGLFAAFREAGGAPDGTEYLLIERAPSLGRATLERLGEAADSAGVRVRLGTSVGGDGPFEGIVIANELLDAQPCRRLRWTGREWTELGVEIDGAHLRPAERPLTSPVPPPALPSGPEPGTIVELSPVAEAIVREIADHLVGGVAIVVDYGAEEEELVRGHPRGTLAAVRGHRPVDDPLEAPGATDLSAFVNFSRVRSAARRAGLVELAYSSQAEALGRWGFPARFEADVRRTRSSEEEVRLRLAAKNLLFGFEGFRALELAARASAPALRGLT